MPVEFFQVELVEEDGVIEIETIPGNAGIVGDEQPAAGQLVLKVSAGRQNTHLLEAGKAGGEGVEVLPHIDVQIQVDRDVVPDQDCV